MSVTPRWWLRLACLLAAVVGLMYGYEFGNRISGPWIGVLLALNCAVFASLMTHGFAQWLGRWWVSLRGRRP